VTAVVFDLGGVLIDWNPRYLYRKLFDGDPARMETFLAEVCTGEWNAQQDAGRPWSEAVAILVARYPEYRDLIAAYDTRWAEMLGAEIGGTVEILRELKQANVHLYALSNWSAEKFPIARSSFEFLDWFDGTVISGEIGVCKPDPRIFRHLLERHELEPGSTVFVDDSVPNVTAAAEMGMIALRFEDADRLRADLRSLGLEMAP
jgi:2-haloacid dehalogenase